MSNPCIIIEISDIDTWPVAHGGGRRLPEDNRPTVLQPDRDTAEKEAKRLARLSPNKRFCILEAQVVATTIEIPSHVTVSGEVWSTRREAVIVTMAENEVPF